MEWGKRWLLHDTMSRTSLDEPGRFLLGGTRAAWTDLERLWDLRILIQTTEKRLDALRSSPHRNSSRIAAEQYVLESAAERVEDLKSLLDRL